jgi:spermidine/putrescine transport system substrate-binding protein
MKLWRHLLFTSCLLSHSIIWASEQKVVNVYNWANAISPSVLRQFEKETGIKVNYSTYSSNEALYAKLAANPNAGYDVIVPSTYFIDRMRKQNMLQKIDKSKLPHFRNISSVFLNKAFDPDNNYSVPYLYGITGIAYNSQYHKNGQNFSWAKLWNPAYKNQLLLIDDTRDVFSIALISLG